MIIDKRTGDVSFQDETIHLTKNEILIIIALSNKKLTTLEEIYECVYKVKVNKLDSYSKMQIYTGICRLRRKLKKYIEIKSINSYGYKLYEL